MPATKPAQETKVAQDIELHFLPTLTTEGRTQRAKELSYSSARSHLAKLSHRKRARKTTISSRVSLTVGSVEGSSGEVSTASHIDDNPGTSSRTAVTGAILPVVLPQPDETTLSPLNDTDNLYRSSPSRSGSEDFMLSLATRKPNGSVQAPLLKPEHAWRNVSTSSLSHLQPDFWLSVSDKIHEPQTYKLLHHCVTVFWPEFDTGFHKPAFTNDWNSFVRAGLIFHSEMWQSAINISFRTGLPITDVASLRHRQQTLEDVSSAIVRAGSNVDEYSMFAMLSLAIPESSDLPKAEGGFLPPFPDVQWLNIYGRAPFIPVHIDAIYHLLNAKGGIDQLSTRAFSADLNFIDAIRSSHRLEKPKFGLSKVFAETVALRTRHNFFGHAAELNQASDDLSILSRHDFPQSTQEIDRLVQHGLAQHLHDVMLDMRAWTMVLQGYLDGRVAQSEKSLLAAHRNILHNKLLHTIPDGEHIDTIIASETEPRDTEWHVYVPIDADRLIQTALIIFALGTTFPLTYRRPFEVLVRRLEAQLTTDMSRMLDSNLDNLVIWLAMVGALGAVHIQSQNFEAIFIQHMRHIEGISRAAPVGVSPATQDSTETLPEGGPTTLVRPWGQVKEECLKTYVWLDQACDEVAREIWRQVEETPAGDDMIHSPARRVEIQMLTI